MKELKKPFVKTNRMEALSDGVFAISITLLAFQLIRQPVLESKSDEELLSALFALWPVFVSYAISFLALGIYWVGDHTLSYFLQQTDRHYLWLNVVFLFSISFIPLSADLLGEKFGFRTATAIYGLNLGAASALLLLKWWCALECWHLIPSGIDPAIRRHIYYRYSVMVILYLIAIAAGLLSPVVSFWAYVLIGFSHLGVQLRTAIMERHSLAPPSESSPSIDEGR